MDDAGSMDEKALMLYRCQFLHHTMHCAECAKRGLLPDFLCSEATSMLNNLIIFSDAEENYLMETNRDVWKEAEGGKKFVHPLYNFWPGIN